LEAGCTATVTRNCGGRWMCFVVAMGFENLRRFNFNWYLTLRGFNFNWYIMSVHVRIVHLTKRHSVFQEPKEKQHTQRYPPTP
jgi:hypothetical protein